MNLTFVEMPWFTRRLKTRLDDAGYRRFQLDLLSHPAKGVVMPGCGGFRKVRVDDPWRQKGTRGGLRVVYLFIPEACRIDLFDIYSKDDKDDLTPTEKRTLAQLARQVREEAITAYKRQRGER